MERVSSDMVGCGGGFCRFEDFSDGKKSVACLEHDSYIPNDYISTPLLCYLNPLVFISESVI